MRRGSPTALAAVAATITLLCACGSPTASPARQRAEARARAEEATRGSSPVTTGATAATRPAPRPPASRLTPDDLRRWADGLRTRAGAAGGIVALRYGALAPVVAISGGAGGEGGGEAGTSLSRADVFAVGRVTESFTAALTLSAAADGDLELGAPIERWVSWPSGERITASQLLQHRSGTAAFGTAGDADGTYDRLLREPAHSYSPDDVLAVVREVAPAAAPNTRVLDNPFDYFLLGYVVEAAAGQPLGTLVEDRLTAPLGLSSTWYPLSGRRGPPGTPGGTTTLLGGATTPTIALQTPAWTSVNGPSGAMLSSVDDLVAWADAVFRSKAAGGIALDAMTVLPASGLDHGIVGITAAGACGPASCPPASPVTRYALRGDPPGSTVRVIYDPQTDVTLVARIMGGTSSVVDDELTALLDSI